MNPELNSASNPEFDDVLLTAYLDNEVTDAERQRVEEQLRTSEASRRLLEELRSVRNMVFQLHNSQPTRSFEQGPWSKTKETEKSPHAELSHGRPAWRVSYQQLASLAALIAIATCISVLVLGPNRESMSLTENSMPSVAPAMPARSSLETKSSNYVETAPSALIVSPENSAPPESQPAELEKNGPVPNETLGRLVAPNGSEMQANATRASSARKEVEARAPVQEKLSAGMPSSAGTAGLGKASGANGAGGFGSLSSDMPMPIPKSKAFDAKLADPAPAAPMILGDSEAAAMKPGIAQATDLATNPASTDSYFFLSLNPQKTNSASEWLLVAGTSEIAVLGAKQVPTNALSEKASETKSDKSQVRARTTYRYVGDHLKENKKSANEIENAKTQTQPLTRIELNQGSKDKQIDDNSNPLDVELQVPEEDWEKGAKRLRQMGVEVPLELPEAEYLDYTATKNSDQDPKRTESISRVRIRVRIMKKLDR